MRLLSVVAGRSPLFVATFVAAIVAPCLLHAGEVTPASDYSVLSPIRSGKLNPSIPESEKVT